MSERDLSGEFNESTFSFGGNVKKFKTYSLEMSCFCSINWESGSRHFRRLYMIILFLFSCLDKCSDSGLAQERLESPSGESKRFKQQSHRFVDHQAAARQSIFNDVLHETRIKTG